MRCLICGRDDERFQLYILSVHALKQFFPSLEGSQISLPSHQEVFNNQPIQVCAECLKFAHD